MGNEGAKKTRMAPRFLAEKLDRSWWHLLALQGALEEKWVWADGEMQKADASLTPRLSGEAWSREFAEPQALRWLKPWERRDGRGEGSGLRRECSQGQNTREHQVAGESTQRQGPGETLGAERAIREGKSSEVWKKNIFDWEEVTVLFSEYNN